MRRKTGGVCVSVVDENEWCDKQNVHGQCVSVVYLAVGCRALFSICYVRGYHKLLPCCAQTVRDVSFEYLQLSVLAGYAGGVELLRKVFVRKFLRNLS